MKLDMFKVGRAAIEQQRHEAHEREIDRNCRMLELARHNGFAIDVRDVPNAGRCWYVPEQLIPMLGFQVAIVR